MVEKVLWELLGVALALLQALLQALFQGLLPDNLGVVPLPYLGLVWVEASMELPTRLVPLPVS